MVEITEKKYKCLRKQIAQDKLNNSYKSYIVLKNYRLQNFLYLKRNRFIYRVVLKILLIWQEIQYTILNINAQVSYVANIGSNTKLPHSANGVVISAKAIIGDNVTIFHQVTIGVRDSQENRNIVIGDNVVLSAGAKIISCTIGDNCKIGPNIVITKDIPDFTLCYNEPVIRIAYYKNKENKQ